MAKLKVLSVNLGLLDYTICGYTFYSYPAFSSQRVLVMPAELLKVDADVIAIQECYSEHHVHYLCQTMKHKYPYFARKEDSSSCFKLHNGLMILSKYEISSCELIRHEKVVCVEDWFANKASLVTEIWLPNVGRIAIINSHLTSGGTDPDSNHSESGREHGIQTAMDCARECRNKGALPLLIGDFNCAPTTSEGNYEHVLNGGFRDAFEEAIANKTLEAECIHHTWDPFHLLNLTGPHAHMPTARLDHVFLPKFEPKFGRVTYANVVFYDKIVKVPVENKVSGESTTMCSLSDHYGLVIEFEILA